MSRSVYARALGPELDRLPGALRDYFAVDDRVIVGEGVFETAGTRLAITRPVLHLMARAGILFPEYGEGVPFRVVNTPIADGGLHAERTFRFPGRERVLQNTMRIVDGRVHDFMGRREGFEIQMELLVDGDRLVMRSARQWIRLAGLRIPLPPFAKVTVTESLDGDRRRVDIRLRSPLLGEWFRYAGSFTYTLEPLA